MGRPRKKSETTGVEFRTDRELVTIYQTSKDNTEKMAAAYELWEKYFRLRMKMRGQLAKVVRDNQLYFPELYEEYDAEAWEKFINQFDGIRLEDVEHLPNWSIYIRLWGYWRSMNRDLLKHWFDWNSNTTPIYSLTKNDGKENGNENLTNLDRHVAQGENIVETGLEVDINKAIFWESIDKLREELTDNQKKLLNMKFQGFKNRDIVKKLNISNKVLKDSLEHIKNRLCVIIVQIGQKNGVETNYAELVECFGG